MSRGCATPARTHPAGNPRRRGIFQNAVGHGHRQPAIAVVEQPERFGIAPTEIGDQLFIGAGGG